MRRPLWLVLLLLLAACRGAVATPTSDVAPTQTRATELTQVAATVTAVAAILRTTQATPAEVGIALADWNWKVVRRFLEERCGLRLSRSTCLRYLHRLGFVLKRPKKRLLKADEARRAAL